MSDKSQVRATGPVDKSTMQPVKGRQRGGGVRFGEMERDGLISHGASFLLHDRLLKCSDATRGVVCTRCGSILSSTRVRSAGGGASAAFHCRSCNRVDSTRHLEIPFVLRLLANELASMNIKLKLDVSEVGMT